MFSFPTALGDCALEWDADGITRVRLPRASSARAQTNPAVDPPAHVRHAAELIIRLLAGERVDLRGIRVSHDERVEPFARRVYAATRELGPGETTSYGEIARGLGDPGAARAVGAALGANPTPLIVPCHRVLAADGSLHGFSAPGGIRTKQQLLEIEGAPGFTQQPLFA